MPEVSFLHATFGGDVVFKGVVFGGDVNFDGVTFGGRADFVGVSFQSNAFFKSAVFAGVATFRRADFSRAARFKEARFDRETTFQGATFGSLAEFEQTRFCRGVNFDEAAFGGEPNFKMAEFDGNASFFGDPIRESPAGRHDILRRLAAFQGARFKERAIFTNRRFLDRTDFRNAVFAIAPEFHDCVLHQGTSFSGADFLDHKGTPKVDAALAYRTLKLLMAGMRATDDEALFHGLEQRSLRASANTPMSVTVASWLYEHTADYGRSFLRPLVWLAGTFVVFSLVYFGYFALFLGPVAIWPDIQNVLRFALQQVFQPFFTFRAGAVVPGAGQAAPLWLAFLAAVHSLSTFSFLALFLLALRRRFRLH